MYMALAHLPILRRASANEGLGRWLGLIASVEAL
jgi:hypothetical protein